MKIDKSGKSLPTTGPLGEGQARTPTAKTSGSAQSATPASTNVHLGEAAAQLQSMQSSMAGSPVVDAAKVAEIKQAISEGRFKVDSGVVADRLIQTVKDLIGAHKA